IAYPPFAVPPPLGAGIGGVLVPTRADALALPGHPGILAIRAGRLAVAGVNLDSVAFAVVIPGPAVGSATPVRPPDRQPRPGRRIGNPDPAAPCRVHPLATVSGWRRGGTPGPGGCCCWSPSPCTHCWWPAACSRIR